MRWLFYAPRAHVGDGGVTNSLWSWVRSLVDAGQKCVVLVDEALAGPEIRPKNPSVMPELLVYVPHRTLGPIAVPELPWLEFSDDLLILSSGWVPSHWLLAYTARRHGVEYAVVPHGAYDPGLMRRSTLLKRAARPLEGSLLRRAAFVHVFFGLEIDHVRAVSPHARCLVAPTGATTSAAVDWTGDGDYLVWFGRYDIEHKGIDLMLNSLASVDVHHRPKVRIFGRDSTNNSTDIRRLVGHLDLDAWVEVNGSLDGEDKAKVLRSSRGYVHPSRWECHSMALAECMAAGVPTIVSSMINVAPDLQVSDAAIVATPGTSEFGLGMQCLADKPNLPLSTAGVDFVRSHLDWESAVTTLTNWRGARR